MPNAIEIDDDLATSLLQQGIRHLGDRKYTYENIAERIRMMTSRTTYRQQNIGALMGGRSIRGLTIGLALSRLMSTEGFDSVADLASAPGKRTLPIPFDLITNDTISDNVTACVEHVGVAVRLDALGRFFEAKQAIGHAIRELHILRLEFEAKRLSFGGDGYDESLNGAAHADTTSAIVLGGLR